MKKDLIKIKLRNMYHDMMKRCYDPQLKGYHRYGGRGITVCEEWKGHRLVFTNWALANGWQPDLTIDRIDNDRGYSPDNCRFVTLRVNRTNQVVTPAVIEAQIRRYANPAERKKTSAGIARSWTNPERRIKQTKAMKTAWQDPDRMKRGKEEMRRRWADPEYKARVSEAIKAAKAKRTKCF